MVCVSQNRAYGLAAAYLREVLFVVRGSRPTEQAAWGGWVTIVLS